MRFKLNQMFFWIGLMVAIVFVYSRLGPNNYMESSKEVPISEFVNYIEAQKLETATIGMTVALGKLKDGTRIKAQILPYYTNKLIDKLTEGKIKTNVLVQTESGLYRFFVAIAGWIPMILFIGVWVYFMKKSSSSGGPGKIFGFGKSKAKVVMPKDIKVRLNDVAGMDEAREEVTEIVDFLKAPKRYVKLGAKIPKGCLLYGSPGTGKTMLAKAIAGESGVPFFHISGSDFVEMFVGVGASRVREMFTEAKKSAPCILFIDEIDAVGRHRGSGVGGGNDEREQTLNQILVEMDGFEENLGVVIIAATNRPDVLDSALLRPGRFDRQVSVPKPDIKGREAIFKVHLQEIKLAPDIEVSALARSTPGFSGAEIANIVNEAALIAGRGKKSTVTMSDFEKAKDKILLGLERGKIVMKEEERKLTAYHEAGHAIAAIHSPGSDPIHKATIIPRGMALGVVMRFPEEDQFSKTRESMLADLTVAMGGRTAEELIFGHNKVTSGAMSDIKQATSLANAMVREWGMSEAVGPVCYPKSESAYQRAIEHSEETNGLLDKEVKSLVTAAHERATKILTEHGKQLETLAKALLKHETLTGAEINQLLKEESDAFLGGKVTNETEDANPNEESPFRSKIKTH